MVSGGVDGERVEVVGEDRPAGPDPLALVALQPAAAQPVAALEVADAALGTGAEAREALAGAARAGFVAAGHEHPLGRELRELVLGHLRPEGAVDGHLSRLQAEPFELGRCLSKQRVLARVAGRAGGGQDEPAGAAAGVGADLGDLRDVAKLVGLTELALADRPRVRVGDRDHPIVIFSPASRCWIWLTTRWQRS